MNNPFILLQSIVNQDKPDASLPLLEDSNLLSVVNAWSKIRVQWEPPDKLEEVPLSDHDLWDVLWGFSVWDFEDLSLAAGITEAAAIRCFGRAKMFRLIYPNGEISASASRVIALVIGATLGEMAERAGGPGSKSGKRSGKKEKFDGDA